METELKSGERILPATRRPDGTMRKPVRIRAGYVPQEEVEIYQSKGALMKKSLPLVPPGYDPDTDSAAKPKTKSAKKNEKRKEKKLQAKSTETAAEVEALSQQVDNLNVSTGESMQQQQQQQQQQEQQLNGEKSEVEKKTRALKKKIRLAQESSSSQQLAKIESWQEELKQLELES